MLAKHMCLYYKNEGINKSLECLLIYASLIYIESYNLVIEQIQLQSLCSAELKDVSRTSKIRRKKT